MVVFYFYFFPTYYGHQIKWANVNNDVNLLYPSPIRFVMDLFRSPYYPISTSYLLERMKNSTEYCKLYDCKKWTNVYNFYLTRFNQCMPHSIIVLLIQFMVLLLH